MSKKIQIIDLFAGPGGLGEGFSNCKDDSPFEIAMSVEFEQNAHKTLTHRAFYRKLDRKGKARFLDYIRTVKESAREKILQELKTRYKDQWDKATDETMKAPHALGNPIVWEKIKAGLEITDEDRKDTPQQTEITKKVKQIKRDCARLKQPLIVIGGPPCQSYSVSGRTRVKAIEGYSPDEDQRFFLYREYCRVLSEAKPDMFIMENVQGILSARLANKEKIFPIILEALKRPYEVLHKKSGVRYRTYSLIAPPDEDKGSPLYENLDKFNVKANFYGVPQTRNRVIILGIRSDHGKIESFMQNGFYLQDDPGIDDISVSDLIGTFPRLRSGISKRKTELSDSYENWGNQRNDAREFLLGNLNGARFKTTKKVLLKSRPADTSRKLERGNDFFVKSNASGFSKLFKRSKNLAHKSLREWIENPELKGFANHSTKEHQFFDRKIYLFVAAWAKAHANEPSPSPKMRHFPGFLTPDHRSWEKGDHSDRFRCLESSKTPYTITSHLKKDGHAFIHYDIRQNRAITPREAARIQTFPDDYFFEGSQGSQYLQVGNAVPPFLARKIALHVFDILKDKNLV